MLTGCAAALSLLLSLFAPLLANPLLAAQAEAATWNWQLCGTFYDILLPGSHCCTSASTAASAFCLWLCRLVIVARR